MMIGIGTPRSQSNIPRPMDFLRLEKCLLNKQLLNSFRAIRSPKNSLRLRAVREPETVDLCSPLANPARDAAADQRIGARRDASRGERQAFWNQWSPRWGFTRSPHRVSQGGLTLAALTAALRVGRALVAIRNAVRKAHLFQRKVCQCCGAMTFNASLWHNDTNDFGAAANVRPKGAHDHINGRPNGLNLVEGKGSFGHRHLRPKRGGSTATSLKRRSPKVTSATPQFTTMRVFVESRLFTSTYVERHG